MGLVEELTGQTVCIDTAPFIYYIEKHSKYSAILSSFYEAIDTGKINAITTTVTLLEVLVRPFKINEESLAKKYRDILLNSEGLTTYEITHEVSEKAAKLRAQYSIGTPDAIQIAVGIIYGAECFLTNDSDLKKISDAQVLLLDDFLK